MADKKLIPFDRVVAELSTNPDAPEWEKPSEEAMTEVTLVTSTDNQFRPRVYAESVKNYRARIEAKRKKGKVPDKK